MFLKKKVTQQCYCLQYYLKRTKKETAAYLYFTYYLFYEIIYFMKLLFITASEFKL